MIKQNQWNYFVRLCGLFICIALSASLARAASLEGYWYGNGYQPEQGKTMQWLTINHPDGSFSVEFRSYANCQVEFFQRETGNWRVSNNIVTKKTLTINGRTVINDDYFIDTYKIIELDDVKMRLVHEKSEQEWTLKRVSKDFTFPNCKNISSDESENFLKTKIS